MDTTNNNTQQPTSTNSAEYAYYKIVYCYDFADDGTHKEFEAPETFPMGKYLDVMAYYNKLGRDIYRDGKKAYELALAKAKSPVGQDYLFDTLELREMVGFKHPTRGWQEEQGDQVHSSLIKHFAYLVEAEEVEKKKKAETPPAPPSQVVASQKKQATKEAEKAAKPAAGDNKPTSKPTLAPPALPGKAPASSGAAPTQPQKVEEKATTTNKPTPPALPKLAAPAKPNLPVAAKPAAPVGPGIKKQEVPTAPAQPKVEQVKVETPKKEEVAVSEPAPAAVA